MFNMATMVSFHVRLPLTDAVASVCWWPFRCQLKHFYFWHYQHTECIWVYFMCVLHKLLT